MYRHTGVSVRQNWKKKSLGGGTSPDLTAVASIIYALRYASGDVIQAVLWLFLLFRISFTCPFQQEVVLSCSRNIEYLSLWLFRVFEPLGSSHVFHLYGLLLFLCIDEQFAERGVLDGVVVSVGSHVWAARFVHFFLALVLFSPILRLCDCWLKFFYIFMWIILAWPWVIFSEKLVLG